MGQKLQIKSKTSKISIKIRDILDSNVIVTLQSLNLLINTTNFPLIGIIFPKEKTCQVLTFKDGCKFFFRFMDIENYHDVINVRWFIIKGLAYSNKFGARNNDRAYLHK